VSLRLTPTQALTLASLLLMLLYFTFGYPLQFEAPRELQCFFFCLTKTFSPPIAFSPSVVVSPIHHPPAAVAAASGSAASSAVFVCVEITKATLIF